jgi:hypothetical protein
VKVDGAKAMCSSKQAMEMLRRRDMNSGAERDRCTPVKHQQGKRVFNISVNAASGRLTKQAPEHVHTV